MVIIDLSWRLPGPLATYFLAKQGMEVIRYEDINHRDPFLKWSWDPSFAEIYEAFQGPKDLRLVDFSSADDAARLREEIRRADAMLMGFPPRVEAKLGLSPEDIERDFHGVSFTRLGFRPGDDHSAHDLNTVAQSGLLAMHILDRTDPIIAPPFLPVSGIFYSYHIAISILATVMEQKGRREPIQNWCYLQDAVDQVQQAYFPPSIQDRSPATFLHNGRFPCYNLYRTSDGGYLAMAAVEPKFWSRFRELAGLASELGDGDGLCDGERAVEVKQIIARAIGARPASEWRDLFAGEDACVDVYLPL